MEVPERKARWGSLRGYVVAVLATAAAVLLRWLMDPPLGDALPLVTLFGAVALAVWSGGYRPGILSTILGFVACDYLFVQPRAHVTLLEFRNLVGFLAYFSTCSIIIWLGHAVRAAQRRAEEHRELLRDTFASIGDAVITTDTQGNVTYMNAVAESLTGWAQREAEHRPLDTVFVIVNDETRGPIEDPTQRALREGVTIGPDNHAVLIRRDGVERSIDDSTSPIRDAQGKAIGCVVTFRDATDRRKAERVQQDIEAWLETELADTRLLHRISAEMNQVHTVEVLYEKTIDAASAIMRSDFASMQRFDPDHGPMGALRLLAYRGFTREGAKSWEWVGADSTTSYGVALRSHERVIVPDVEKCAFLAGSADLEAYRETGIRALQTTLLLSHSRSVVGAISTYWREPQTPSERDLLMLDILARQAADLLERTQVDRVVRESEQRYRSLVSVIADVPWTTDATGGFKSPQEAWNAYTGQSWDEHRGFGWINAVHPDERDQVRRIWQRACETRTTYETHGRLWNAPSEQWRHYVARATPVLNPDGSLREWVGACTDVDDMVRATERLKDADRRKDEFLAILAHELRNPLSPVRNAAQYLGLQNLPDPELRGAVEMIERQVEQMARLIDDLLDVSRITRGVVELQLERVDFAEIAKEVVETCKAEVESRGHGFRMSWPKEPVTLEADRHRLIQALGNLVTNAVKYTPEGGEIGFTARIDDETLEVLVEDNGNGIPPSKLSEIFDLFAQVDRSQERQGGLGIGLTLARQLIGLHHGTIEARSDGIGQGSTFVVRLPIVSGGPESTAASSPPESSVESLRVLIVDDNQDAAESLALVLQAAGHSVRFTTDARAGLAIAEAFAPEVAFLDIGMPEMNGYDLAGRIRTEPWGKSIHLVALTGWGQEADRKRSEEAGFDAHVVKPASPDLIDEILGRIGARAT